MSRKKSDVGVTKFPCGCERNDTEWLKLCVPCGTEIRATSKRWAEERANPTPPTTIRYHGQAKPATNEDLI